MMNKVEKTVFIILFAIIAVTYVYLLVYNLGYQAGEDKVLRENSTVLIEK